MNLKDRDRMARKGVETGVPLYGHITKPYLLKRKNDEVDPTEVMFMYEQPQEVEERERPEDIIPDLPENQEVCHSVSNL